MTVHGRGANSAYTAGELLHQLRATNAALVIAHPELLRTAVSAARQAGVAASRVVALDVGVCAHTHVTVEALVQEGLRMPGVVERRLAPGEARSKIAFVNFSSGTTGKPKVCVKLGGVCV